MKTTRFTSILISLIIGLLPVLTIANSSYAFSAPFSKKSVTNEEILDHVSLPEEATVNTNDTKYGESLDKAREYVSSSTIAWNTHQAYEGWEKKAEKSQEELKESQIEADEANRIADLKDEEAHAAAVDALGWYRAQQRNPASSRTLAIAVADDPESLMRSYQAADSLHRRANESADEAELAAEEARVLREDAMSALAEVAAKHEEVEEFLSAANNSYREAEEQQQEASDKWNSAWRELAVEEMDNPVPLGSRILNAALVIEWNNYLDEIKNKGTDIPTQAELQDPKSLPDGIEIAGFTEEDMVVGLGVIKGEDDEELLVPSQESILRTSLSLSRLGEPFLSGEEGNGEEGWSCAPFATNGTDLNDAYETQGAQLPSLTDSASGDVVFYADPAAGIHHAGVYAFGGFVISASASTGLVSASPMAVDAIGVVRPGTDPTDNESAPERLPGALKWECGGISGVEDADTDGWLLPIPEEDSEIGLQFKDEFGKFDEGSPGLELVSSKDQTIYASFDGTVTDIRNKKGIGKILTITHSKSVTSTYYGLSEITVEEGSKVKRADAVGVIGNSIQSKRDYSILIEVRTNDKLTDPETLFFPQELNGQHPNGRIPASALCSTPSGGLLECNAARSYALMADEFTEDLGKPLEATDSYRPFDIQVKCREEKGALCATPGASNHGWGLAVDFTSGIQDFGTPEHEWMKENAPRFGWVHPEWARSNGAKPEPWHWEYGNLY